MKLNRVTLIVFDFERATPNRPADNRFNPSARVMEVGLGGAVSYGLRHTFRDNLRQTDYGFDRLNPVEAELPGVDGLDEGGLWHDASPEVGQQEIVGQ